MPTTKLPTVPLPKPLLANSAAIDGVFFLVNLKDATVLDDGSIHIGLSSFDIPVPPGIPPPWPHFDEQAFAPPDASKRETLALVLFAISRGVTVVPAWLQLTKPVGKSAALQVGL